MTKSSTVSYKLGIDAMRGKLATKQRDIRYAGQQVGANTLTLGYGKHTATNFDKYLVLTQRRGKNFFYVKSRTTLRNNLATTFSRSLLAIAQDIASYLVYWVEQSNDTDYREIRRAYEYYGEGKTLREFLISAIIESVTARQQVITVRSVPVDPAGNTRALHLINNPLYNTAVLSANVVAVEPQGQPELYMSNLSARRLMQEYMEYQTKNMGAEKNVVAFVDTRNGRTYKRTLLYTAGSDSLASLEATVQGAAYEMTFQETGGDIILKKLSIIDNKGVVLLTGQPFLDEEKTEPVEKSMSIAEATTLYI